MSTCKLASSLRTVITNSYVREYLWQGPGRKVLVEGFAKMKPPHHQLRPNLKMAAVLLPLCIVNNEVSILFTKKSIDLSTYGGQVR